MNVMIKKFPIFCKWRGSIEINKKSYRYLEIINIDNLSIYSI